MKMRWINGVYTDGRLPPKLHAHVNMYFRTPDEYDRSLADGAIRCMTQLIVSTRGREPAPGFRHMLSALLEGMADLRKEMDP